MVKLRLRPSYLLILLAVTISGFLLYKNWQSKFEAPRKDTPDIQFTIGKDRTLQSVIGDLKYYDFIKDEEAFTFALEHTQDNTQGSASAIKVGKDSKTIDREAVYTISQSMTAWELASVLLNKGTYQDCNHGCPESNFIPELLPGGDLAPTLKEKYSWVKTYNDCVKAIGHDGGQLSSEQYAQKTGIRICNTADGRYFVQGKEGYTDYPPYP
ncbi:MAG TPA: hypothetical protein VF185_04755 [Patescibacteria group bacterium]